MASGSSLLLCAGRPFPAFTLSLMNETSRSHKISGNHTLAFGQCSEAVSHLFPGLGKKLSLETNYGDTDPVRPLPCTIGAFLGTCQAGKCMVEHAMGCSAH